MCTTADLLKIHDDLCAQGRTLMERKNHDYGAAGRDPFANFRADGAHGITVRMNDKLSRLRTYVSGATLMVTDEGVLDTVIDNINYSVLLYAFLHRKKVEL